MIYFYAGLGTAMLTGIMLLFEVGLALTGQSLFVAGSSQEDYRDVTNELDYSLLPMLTRQQDLKAIGTGRFGTSLCQQILCRINGLGCKSGNSKHPLYGPLGKLTRPKFALPLGVWSSTCVLVKQLGKTNQDEFYRVLIRPNRNNFGAGYEFYSCVVQGDEADPRCLFEKQT